MYILLEETEISKFLLVDESFLDQRSIKLLKLRGDITYHDPDN